MSLLCPGTQSFTDWYKEGAMFAFKWRISSLVFLMRFLPILSLVGLLVVTASAEPSWIWSSNKAGDKDAPSFKISFEVPGEVKSGADLHV